MNLIVQYTAQLRTVLGRVEEQVDLPEGSNVADLLMLLASRCDTTARSHLVNDRGQTRPSLLVVVNDLAVSAREASHTILRSGDVVILMPPIASG